MNICIFCKKVPEMAVCPAGRERKYEAEAIKPHRIVAGGKYEE